MNISVTDGKIKVVMSGYTLDNADAYWTENGNTVHIGQLEDTRMEYKDNDLTVEGAYSGRRILWEIKNHGGYISTRLTISADSEIYVEGICAFKAKILASSPQKFLRVPFDNDDWVKYEVTSYENAETGYGVGAVYGENSALAIGVLDYNIWKTGIIPAENIEVFSGIADKLTRDTQPHGIVHGKTVSSPEIYISCSDTWQMAMADFACEYERHNERLVWEKPAPFGWNSWYAYMSKIDKEKYLAASDFVKKNEFENKGASYINFDSFWNNLAEDDLYDAVKKVNKQGQTAGIYAAPFSGWVKEEQLDTIVTYDMGQEVCLDDFEGTVWRDIILKDKNGEILPPVDGGYPLDVTHPVTIERIRGVIEFAADAGYKYIKMDFLAHGAIEGERYDKSVMTGIMAYDLAMKYTMNMCVKAGMFISLSIAPVFPGGYGHARRICCDVFEKEKDTKYLLNSLTYGFWQNKRIYEFTDPDHICFNGSYSEAKSHLVSAVIGGSVMLMSNNVTDEKQNERVEELISNQELLDIAREHITFIPVDDEGAEEYGFASVFISEDGKYYAVFNLTDKDKEFTIPSENEEFIRDVTERENIPLCGNGCAVKSIKAGDCAVFRIGV